MELEYDGEHWEVLRSKVRSGVLLIPVTVVVVISRGSNDSSSSFAFVFCWKALEKRRVP